MKSDRWQVTCDKINGHATNSCHVSRVTCHAFTLIELLVVIAIIAILSAPVSADAGPQQGVGATRRL